MTHTEAPAPAPEPGTRYAWISDKLRELGHNDLADSADWANHEMKFLSRELAYERARRASAQAPAPAPETQVDRDAQEQPFEDYWQREGQFSRAGGGQYEKTFAWNAWCAALATRSPAVKAEPWTGWVCKQCGIDRCKAACPLGHGAALTGQCPMVGVAASHVPVQGTGC